MSDKVLHAFECDCQECLDKWIKVGKRFNMTKQNPEILCQSCAEFDYAMNRQGGTSCDMNVRCDCGEAVPIKERIGDEDEIT